MIALKKLYGEELLRLALMLSLLRADPEQYLRDDSRLLAGGLVNGTDWAPEITGIHTRTRYLHPKSLDSILLDYERDVFEELHSLGRWGHPGETREAIQAYLLNGVENNAAQQQAATQMAQDPQEDSLGPYSLLSTTQLENEDVEQCVTVKTEEDVGEGTQSVASATLSTSFIRNLTTFRGPLMEEDSAQSAPFDVSQFFADPIKVESDEEANEDRSDDGVRVKQEGFEGDDNAIDDYIPFYMRNGGDSITNQNLADLTDFDETAETLEQFKRSIQFLDVRQQSEDLEKYLIENTDLDIEETCVTTIKRERASTSFTSAGSSGVGDEASSSSSSCNGTTAGWVDLKIEEDEGLSSGDELTQEDMDLIEVLWKQDEDMGFCVDAPPQTMDPTKCVLPGGPFSPVTAASSKPAKGKTQEEQEIDKLKDALQDACEPKEHQGSPSLVDTTADDLWAGLDYTVDTETGEYVLSTNKFNLLEEALQLVGIEDGPDLEDLKSSASPGDQASEEGGEAGGAMLAGRYGGAGPAHPHHPHHAHHHAAAAAYHHHHHQQQQQHLAAAYHHQNLVRSMSMEQRWQDLATLLALPAPPQQQQHDQHDLYHHQHISSHGAQMSPGYVVPPYAPLSADKSSIAPPLPPPDLYGAANLGSAVAASMNVGPAPSAPAPPPPPPPFYKAEHHEQEQCYYQNATTELNGTSDGFLSSILNDEDLQLMDMAMNEGMYTMRMLESAGGHSQAGGGGGGQQLVGVGAAPAQCAPHHQLQHQMPPHLQQHQQQQQQHSQINGHHITMGSERIDASSDSAVSSMGSERVPSLSDSEWCDGGSDSAQDYHGSKMRSCEGEPRQAPLVAQKKHHMFGKRCFQEQTGSVIRPRPNGDSSLPLHPALKFEYEQPTLPTASYAPDVGHLTPEMKYSCTMEFTSGLGGAGTAARHNHTYSLPPAPPQPPHRPLARDKRGRRGGDGMGVGACGGVGPLTRDEKRARALGVAGIPLNVHDIINLPMDEFNERLSKHDLSETQLSLIRDIRRRGKNKVAAQNCRKRKLDQITSLADEVRDARTRKQRLQREHQMLLSERQRTKEHFAALYRHVFQHLRDSDGNPLSSQQYSLQQAADGAVVLVPRSTSRNSSTTDRHMSSNGTSEDELERIKLKHRKSFDQ